MAMGWSLETACGLHACAAGEQQAEFAMRFPGGDQVSLAACPT
jgi:hypothetical protein